MTVISIGRAVRIMVRFCVPTRIYNYALEQHNIMQHRKLKRVNTNVTISEAFVIM